MEKLVRFVKDLLKAVLLGSCVAAGAGLLFWLIGLAVSNFSAAAALGTAWRWMLILGAGLLLLSAGFLLRSGKKDTAPAGWKQHFSTIGLTAVILTTAVMVLLAASLLELLARG